MRLKNFIAKQKSPKVKETRTFRTSIKPAKKETRASEKKSLKLVKRLRVLLFAGGAILLLVFILSLIAFFYRNYIIERLKPGEIISPGVPRVIQIYEAEEILKKNNIEFSDFGYASGSSVLSLTLDEGTHVYFSNSTDFNGQAQILADIVYTLKSEGKNASIIDLRYNRPIVKF